LTILVIHMETSSYYDSYSIIMIHVLAVWTCLVEPLS